jgi:hypothetical protein
MVAIFTARKEVQQIAFEKSAGIEPFPDQHLYPDAQFKGAVLYEGRIQVTMPAPGGQVAVELLDGLYADGPIVATDEIFIETDDLAIAGAWTVGTVTDPSADVDPLDPPASIEILQIDPENTSGSHATIVPNRTRGRIDTIVDARISAAVTLLNANLRARGTLGFSRSSDNLRQLTFQGVVAGTWGLGATVTGGTSGAVGKIVGLGPAINQGLGPDSFGFFITVDMGIDYAGAEWDVGTPDVVSSSTGGASGTLKSAPFAGRSTGVLFRPSSNNPAFASGRGTKMHATSGTMQIIFPDKIVFPAALPINQNGIWLGDILDIQDPPIEGIFTVVGFSGTNLANDTIRVDPPHNAADDPSEFISPIDVLYNPDVSPAPALLVSGLAVSMLSAGVVDITDGRSWPDVGVLPGDDIRVVSVSGTNDGDIRFGRIQSTGSVPFDRGFLPGDLNSFGSGTDTMDVFLLRKGSYIPPDPAGP